MMSSPRNLACHAAQRTLLFAASLVVPSSRRADWWREWASELWHIRNETTSRQSFSTEAEAAVFSFCFGSFRDAQCLRREAGTQAALVHSSAWRCVYALALALVFCVLVSRLLPGVRAEQEAAHYALRSGLLLVQSDNQQSTSTPVVTASQYRDWRSTQQRYFDGLAFYTSARQRATVDGLGAYSWQVAQASANIFSLLGLPVQMSDGDTAASGDIPAAVLSYDAWVRDFGADTHVTGRIIHMGMRQVRIVGVAPCNSVQLPTHPDLWLLDSSDLTKISGSTRGFLIALLSPLGKYVSSSMDGRMPIGLNGVNDEAWNLIGISLADQDQGIWPIAAFALFLALLALPAVASVSLSESAFSSHRPTFKRRLVRWTFLVASSLLVIGIALFASLIVAYAWTPGYSPTAEFAQLAAGFTFTLLGLRWVILDQRKRCPVCMRHVTHPASVGSASQTFLGWNGTEMMCVGGHTLLHVPSLPTSWFGAQRWLYLDTSWEFLFADPFAP